MDDNMVQSVITDRADKRGQHERRQHLHQEPAGIPAAKEQWDQFRVRTCADRRERLSVKGLERKESLVYSGERGGGTIEGRTRAGRKG